MPLFSDRDSYTLGWKRPNRPRRLRMFADAYGLTPRDRHRLVRVIRKRIVDHVEGIRRMAAAGEPAFVRIVHKGHLRRPMRDLRLIDYERHMPGIRAALSRGSAWRADRAPGHRTVETDPRHVTKHVETRLKPAPSAAKRGRSGQLRRKPVVGQRRPPAGDGYTHARRGGVLYLADPPAVDTGNTAWLLVSTALVLLMTPGLALFYGGLNRSKGVLNMMMMSFSSHRARLGSVAALRIQPRVRSQRQHVGQRRSSGASPSTSAPRPSSRRSGASRTPRPTASASRPTCSWPSR